MRLINADKLKQYIDDCECCEKCDKIGFMCNDDCELPDFLTPQWERVLNEQPTVDAEPVRHGKWEPVSEDWRHQIEWWECSECNFSASIKYNYCPHCGAKMGEENGV